MNAKTLTILLTSFLFTTVFSQEENIVHFFSNKTIEIETLDQFDTGLYGSDLIVNGKKLNADKVDFIKNEGEVFGNLINAFRTTSFVFFKDKKASVFVPRTQEGKINIFEKRVIVSRTSSSGMSQGSESFVDYFYNESEYGTIKKANFKNLHKKFKSNKTAYRSLVRYRNLDITGKVLGYSGVAGVVGAIGVVAYELISNKDPGGNPNVANYIIVGSILAPSIVMVFGSKLVKKPKRKALEKALDIYNK
jgi:hypothetical protein